MRDVNNSELPPVIPVFIGFTYSLKVFSSKNKTRLSILSFYQASTKHESQHLLHTKQESSETTVAQSR